MYKKFTFLNVNSLHFISRSLTKAERNYGITDLEGAALYYCLVKFKPYIMGNINSTVIFTDHKPLIGLIKNKEPHNARQTRWCLIASLLGVDVKYESGKRNVVADALSLMKTTEDKKILVTQQENANESNLMTKVIKEFMEEKLTMIDGVKYFIDGGNYRKVVTDTNEKLRLILEAHKIGHEGSSKTYQRLKRNFYWNNMTNDIKRIIQKCDICQLNKSQSYLEPTEKFPTEPEGPFTHLDLDIIGPLVKTRRSNQYIIVVWRLRHMNEIILIKFIYIRIYYNILII